MAIDSADKRSSAIFLNIPWRGMLPLPDGSLNQPDRQHVALMYRGIAAGGAVAVVTLRKFMGLFRDPGRVGKF